MGCILYPPVTLVDPLHRLRRLQQRRRSTRTTQPPVFTRAPSCTPSCISTSHASSWRWRVLLSQLSSPALPTTALQATLTNPVAHQTPTSTPTATTTNEKRNNYHKLYKRKENKLVPKRKVKKIMEQRVIAIPSIALSLSILALGAAIGSSSGCGSHSPTPPSGTLSWVLGKGTGVGLGLNLSTLAPLLTLAWHAFNLLSRARDGDGDDPDSSYHHLSPASAAGEEEEEDATRPSPRIAGPRTQPHHASGCAPHTLVLVWVLNTLVLVLVPRWTSATAFSYAGLAVLSALEAGVLALAGVLARYHVQLALAAEMDDEYGWEHVDRDVSDCDCDDDDDDDDTKLGEI